MNASPEDLLDVLKQLLPLTILAAYNPSILKYQLCLAANALTVMNDQENKNAENEVSDTDSSGCGPGAEDSNDQEIIDSLELSD